MNVWVVDWLVGWVGGCLAGWLIGWLAGWVGGWFALCTQVSGQIPILREASLACLVKWCHPQLLPSHSPLLFSSLYLSTSEIILFTYFLKTIHSEGRDHVCLLVYCSFPNVQTVSGLWASLNICASVYFFGNKCAYIRRQVS